MKKIKVYLDTSVISYLQQEDASERIADTLTLWEEFQKGKYDIYLSTVTLEELDNCPEPKKTRLFQYMAEIQYTILPVTKETQELAEKIISMGILTRTSFDDCQHIAAAVLSECDCIISWNFKHIVNIRTIRGVRAITNLEGYKTIEIINPSALLGSGE